MPIDETFSKNYSLWTQYNAIINAAELTRYVQVKQTILKLPGFTENVVTHLFAGLGAGFFAVCIGFPVDVDPDVICTEGVSHNREKMHSLLDWVSDGRIEMRITCGVARKGIVRLAVDAVIMNAGAEKKEQVAAWTADAWYLFVENTVLGTYKSHCDRLLT
ncbi:hypothetical protein ACS0TY_004708 [Phlomoides rotata]